MKLQASFVTIVLLHMTNAALAGSWSSGGGHLFTNEFNPWFVQNTEPVRYCIQIDKKNFGVGLDQVRIHIKEAIKYWKNEFEQLEDLQDHGSPVEFTKVHFKEVS